MRILNTFLAVVVAVLVVLFAVSNRAPVVVEIWPFPYRLELSLYALILLAVFLGFLAGMITFWLTGGKRRRELKALRKETRDLQASLARAAALSGLKDPGSKDLPR
ncbi:MAG: LapA family protein [Rhodospirillaceae bacterium]|nr:LapA family protein [Rhodospirillaceae bacterium]